MAFQNATSVPERCLQHVCVCPRADNVIASAEMKAGAVDYRPDFPNSSCRPAPRQAKEARLIASFFLLVYFSVRTCSFDLQPTKRAFLLYTAVVQWI